MRKILCATMVLSFLCIALLSTDADALPVFARKYRTSCSTCHAPFPKLSAFGEAFRLNGYKIPDADELYVKEEPVTMGAEAYKKVFPQSIWPSTLPLVPPVSFREIGEVLVDAAGHQHNKTQFNFQNEANIHAAGTFGEHMSFFAEFAFTHDFGNGGVSGTDFEAWLMWQSLFADWVGANHFNIKGGNLGKLEMSLPNIKFDNSYQANDYLYAGDLGLGTAPGFEINGFGKNWQYHVGLVDTDQANSHKDFYGQLNFKVGGLGFDGTGGTFEQGGLKIAPAGYWRDDSITFGMLALRSYAGDPHNPVAPTPIRTWDRIGGDVRLNYGDFSIAGGYLRGENHGVIPDSGEPGLFENCWVAEAHYWVYPWLLPYVRYEFNDVTNVPDEDRGRFVLGVTALVAANVRVNVEGRIYTTNQPANAHLPANVLDPDLLSTIDNSMVTFRLDWAF